MKGEGLKPCRTMADMMRDYDTNIADINKRIESLKLQQSKLRVHSTDYNELAERINSLEIMRGDMVLALHKLKKYAM